MHEASEELSVVQCGWIPELKGLCCRNKIRRTEMSKKWFISSKYLHYRVRDVYINIIKLYGVIVKFLDILFSVPPKIKNVHESTFLVWNLTFHANQGTLHLN